MVGAGEAALLPLQRRMLPRQCHMRHLRCRTWRLRREWLRHAWQRRPHRTSLRHTWLRRISPRRRTWPRLISLHLRTPWPCRTAELVMKLLTSLRGEVSRMAEEWQQRVRSASAPSIPRANSSTAQRARRRPRRTPSSTERPMRRPQPLRDSGPARTVMKPLAKVPLAKVLPGPEKTRGKSGPASRGIRETCHALSNASPSSAGRQSFEIRYSQVRKLCGGGRRAKRSRQRRSGVTSPSRPCMIVAITAITI